MGPNFLRMILGLSDIGRVASKASSGRPNTEGRLLSSGKGLR
jgi:hypothetical protein